MLAVALALLCLLPYVAVADPSLHDDRRYLEFDYGALDDVYGEAFISVNLYDPGWVNAPSALISFQANSNFDYRNGSDFTSTLAFPVLPLDDVVTNDASVRLFFNPHDDLVPEPIGPPDIQTITVATEWEVDATTIDAMFVEWDADTRILRVGFRSPEFAPEPAHALMLTVGSLSLAAMGRRR